MSLKRHPAQWPWHGLLVLILLGLAIGLWVATKRVNYEWRWERVPQYFAYRAEAPQDTPISGQVSAIAPEGRSHRLVITPEGSGPPVMVTVEQAQVAVGATVAENDTVGVNFEWRVGPLTQGLWVTIWISCASSRSTGWRSPCCFATAAFSAEPRAEMAGWARTSRPTCGR